MKERIAAAVALTLATYGLLVTMSCLTTHAESLMPKCPMPGECPPGWTCIREGCAPVWGGPEKKS